MPAIEVYVETEGGDPYVGVWVDIRNQSDLSLEHSSQTASDGKIAPTLDEGDYIATLRDGTRIFSENNTLFTVSDDNDPLELSGTFIDPITPGVPVGMVTGTATLRYPNGQPVVGATIIVSMYQPQLEGGALYTKGSQLITGRDGSVTENFVPGLQVVMTVEGTHIFRQFEVPDANFNIMSTALSTSDPFTIQSPSFPIAPTHSP